MGIELPGKAIVAQYGQASTLSSLRFAPAG
jgi:hypothetical protein